MSTPPSTTTPTDCNQLLKTQIEEITTDPGKLAKLPHSTTIYHELLRPEAYRTGTAPSSGSLFEESQALMFGGADTTGTTLMHGCFYILSSKEIYAKIKAELVTAWPILDGPPLSWEELEKLPYLVSCR